MLPVPPMVADAGAVTVMLPADAVPSSHVCSANANGELPAALHLWITTV